jgi:type IV secretory pathway ATPase VirB11/archaellum biosynthesis ATPase
VWLYCVNQHELAELWLMHMAPRVVHFALLSSTTTSTKTTASIQALDLISSHKQNMTSSSKALISIACQTA